MIKLLRAIWAAYRGVYVPMAKVVRLPSGLCVYLPPSHFDALKPADIQKAERAGWHVVRAPMIARERVVGMEAFWRVWRGNAFAEMAPTLITPPAGAIKCKCGGWITEQIPHGGPACEPFGYGGRSLTVADGTGGLVDVSVASMRVREAYAKAIKAHFAAQDSRDP